MLVCLLGQCRYLLPCSPCSAKHLCTGLTLWPEDCDVAWQTHKKTGWANQIPSLRNMN